MKTILIIPFLLLLITGSINAQISHKPDRDTISLSENGTRYRMIVVGDKLPEFYVNEKRINREDFGNYEEVIGKMQLILLERKRNIKSSKNNQVHA